MPEDVLMLQVALLTIGLVMGIYAVFAWLEGR